ncbi:hypothetical protein EJB05_23873, partial [Eragrostis curvula]
MHHVLENFSMWRICLSSERFTEKHLDFRILEAADKESRIAEITCDFWRKIEPKRSNDNEAKLNALSEEIDQLKVKIDKLLDVRDDLLEKKELKDKELAGSSEKDMLLQTKLMCWRRALENHAKDNQHANHKRIKHNTGANGSSAPLLGTNRQELATLKERNKALEYQRVVCISGRRDAATRDDDEVTEELPELIHGGRCCCSARPHRSFKI